MIAQPLLRPPCSTALAVIGLLRGRCRWYAIVMYLFCIATGSFLFRGVLWISEKIAQSDTISNGLFWTSAAACAIEALSISPQIDCPDLAFNKYS